MELLSELAPGSGPIGMLVDPNNPNTPADRRAAQQAAAALGRQLLIVDVASESEIDAAFADLAGRRISALFVDANVALLDWRGRIVMLAARHGLAASYAAREFVTAGGLMTYAPDEAALFRQLGGYAARVLKGAKPADLPVEQPVKIALIINLKTAKTLGLRVPDGLLALADEVIE
jgi:putative tryptophan/tyrosine transport system substrate-binding protein